DANSIYYTSAGDTIKNIYSNIGSEWANSSIAGSLMIRPVFADVEIVSGISEDIEKEAIDVYPNPTTGKIYIPSGFDRVEVLDFTGKPLQKIESGSSQESELIITNLPPGFYLLRIEQRKKLFIKKIILKP
ncbi:MAG TPA: T9SS type A sorting domain-containing protein, partial [Cytophagales bacterium]|nr:T9SS type A sorting domain-containing protein [Cytophagales bacterium]